MPPYRKRKYTPKKGKGKSYGKARNYKRKYHNYKRKYPAPNSILSLDKYRCKLKYSDYVQLTLDANEKSVALLYSLNSIYDPYYDVGGSTIIGYDKLSAIWHKYVVTGCKVTVKFMRLDGPYPSMFYIQGYSSSDKGTAAPTWEEMTQQSINNVHKTILPHHGDTDTFQKAPVIKKYFSISKLEGHKIRDDLSYSAEYNADPTNECVALIGFAFPLAYAANTGTMDFQIYIKYYATLYDRVEDLDP